MTSRGGLKNGCYAQLYTLFKDKMVLKTVTYSRGKCYTLANSVFNIDKILNTGEKTDYSISISKK